jgi:hypothetical protein
MLVLVGFAGWMWHLIHAVSNGFEHALEEPIHDAFLLHMPGVFGNIKLYKETFQVRHLYPITSFIMHLDAL